jgi:tetratricopeptide (TPR) repeat protein
VWYRKVYGFDDARTFAAALGDFLHRMDRPRLRSYLASGGFDGDGLSAILREDLAGVLVVADDVHASPEAAGFLRLAADAGRGGKVLATARERPDVLAGGRREGPAEVVLGGLDPAASRALVARLLPKDPERVERVVAAGRGHPIALHVLAAVDPPAGPSGAERLLEDAILEGLDPALERAAVSLAVLRVPVERPADLGVSASPMRRLAGRGLLSRGPGGFALHDLVKDVLLPRTSAPALRRAHAAAARSALRHGDAIEAAWHTAESGRPRRAREILLTARNRLLDSPKVGELARLLARLPRTAGARLLLAEALDRLGRSDEARALLTGIVEGPGHPRRADALLLLGRIESRRNALGEAQRALRDAIAAAERSPDPGIEGRARRILAVVLRKLGDYDAAVAELARAIPLLEAAGERRERVSAALDGAVIRLLRGDVAGAATELEGLLRDPAAGPREGAAARSNLAIAWARMGRPVEAAELFEESARSAEAGGDFRAAGYALANAADAYLAADRIPEAEASLARARRVSEGFADPLLESTVLTNEGKVLAAQGRPGPAEERLRAGVERIRGLGNVASLIDRVDELARFYERAGRPEDAERARRDLEGLRDSLPGAGRPAPRAP